MRKAAEIKLYDENNVTYFIEKDFSGVSIIKQEQDPDSSNTRDRIHTTMRLNHQQAEYLSEALRELLELDNIESWKGTEVA